MAYQVLARKYRPQRFSQVVGQEHVTQTLMNALAAGRLHHAYLFAGARGTGKTTVARILAKALNCKQKEGAEPCGTCIPCTEITGGASLDVQEIDGASNTGVDDVRELREHARYMPSSGKYKIYIIDEVHMLSGSAFNALLKTLEEPPAHVVFIFATTEAHKLPATILSRCQRYDFRRIPLQAMADTLGRIALEEKVAVDVDALRLIAREATGSLRDAESLLDQAIAFSGGTVSADTIKAMLGFLDRKLLFDAVGAVIARDAARALAVLDEVFKQGADLSRFAMDILELLRHMLVLAECGDERGAVDLLPDEVGQLKAMLAGNAVRGPELHQMFSLWYRVAEDVPRSPFPKMLLEVGLMRLCRVGPVKPIEEIMARIDAVIEQGSESNRPLRGDSSLGDNFGGENPLPTAGAAVPLPSLPRRNLPAQAVPEVSPAKPTFEPVVSPLDTVAEKRWEEFMRFLATEKPQIASLFQHGVLVGIDDGVVKATFDNPLYSDMLSEASRKAQVEGLFEAFFKRPMRLMVGRSGGPSPSGARGEQKKEMMREALGSDIVRQAADILNARVHEVKVEGEK
ncbi:MAG: DNA polymerase III subunit gamma/tau [Pseudomonadota bacterium]